MIGSISAGSAASPLAPFDELLTEIEVCERYSHLLGERELREARRDRQIAFVTGKKGAILYRPAWVADYLNRKITPCQPLHSGSGNTETIGSTASLGPITSTHIGGTVEQDELVAEVLTRKYLPKLKSV
ncbi:hypothetical protein V5279_38015 [Bradyrhizobium sp. 26S5]|uniref:hypothetical protein n=1 Tax=Bradyrhizobium sp. 26S5 TaxID=3139729 RepID=UPI0030D20702